MSKLDAGNIRIVDVEKELSFLPDYLKDPVRARVVEIVVGVQKDIEAAMEKGGSVEENVMLTFNDDFSTLVKSRHDFVSRMIKSGVFDVNSEYVVKALVYQYLGVKKESIKGVFDFDEAALQNIINNVNASFNSSNSNVKIVDRGGVLFLSINNDIDIYVNERLGKALVKETNRLATLKGRVNHSRRGKRMKKLVGDEKSDEDSIDRERAELLNDLKRALNVLKKPKSELTDNELVNTLMIALNASLNGAPAGEAFQALVVENQNLRAKIESLDLEVTALKYRLGD
ncbi:hypothetical protein COU74_01525 [Candidatus Peregrinibacteria bacterium CG10_big_fil_rev_8_21_14_0_10_36_19]|nr:MAG: hypothetical protein COU74_01525 [Candidatus Peregrinibacteria bacterium CG10_big_fil_rev_8_21_14_0_10_36_19]